MRDKLLVGVAILFAASCNDPGTASADGGCASPLPACDLPDGAVASCAMCPDPPPPPDHRPVTVEVPCDVEVTQTMLRFEGDTLRAAYTDWYAEHRPEDFDPMETHHAVQAFACDWQTYPDDERAIAGLVRPSCDEGDPLCAGEGEERRLSACREVPVLIDDGVLRVHCGLFARIEEETSPGTWEPARTDGSGFPGGLNNADQWATSVRLTIWPARED